MSVLNDLGVRIASAGAGATDWTVDTRGFGHTPFSAPCKGSPAGRLNWPCALSGGPNVTPKRKLYITHPGFGRTYHVFDEDHRSLCGKAMMFTRDPELCSPVEGNEVYRKGEDCKACFRKAGLKIEEEP